MAGPSWALKEMVMIADRPDEVNGRKFPGHWQGDLILNSANISAIETIMERTSGFHLRVHLQRRKRCQNPFANGQSDVWHGR